MKVILRSSLAFVLLLSLPSDLRAFCKAGFGFPVYQCADRAFLAPPPEGSGSVSALFWQIGFGNGAVNNGEGSTGLGIFPAGVFSGNDSGLLTPRLSDARSALGDARVPAGALCLDPLNWADTGIDGCCDDARDPNMRGADDAMLNPYFDTRIFRKEGRIVATRDRIQDYPMAVLFREETGEYFAVAAVASAARGEKAEEDMRAGHFTFADLRDGEENPLTGARNVIPWQSAPKATLHLLGRGQSAPEDGQGPSWRVRVRWDMVRLPSDLSHRPSEAYEIDNPGHGVGVEDMGPLVWYAVEKAPFTSGMIGEDGYPLRELIVWEAAAETPEAETILDIREDTCVRVAVYFGKRPRTRSALVKECALGRCGDISYRVAGPPACLEGPVLAKTGRRGAPG